jgi:hypothetical protein
MGWVVWQSNSPVGAGFATPINTSSKAYEPPEQQVPGLFAGDEADGPQC